MDNLRKNQIYTVKFDGYTSEALGVCHVGERAVFVPKALRGERAEIRIVKVTASAVYGRLERLIEASPARLEPACSYFGRCGGCDTWHMSYSEELRFKLDRVNSALKHIGGQTLEAKEILGCDEPLHYRNKAIFSVADIDGAPRYGFFQPRSHDLVAVDSCLIQSDLSCRAAKAVTEFMAQNTISAYDEATGKGVVRHVFCRQSRSRAQAVACVVAARGFGAKTESLVDFLRERCPELSGIVLNINKTRGNTVLAGDFHTLWGSPNIVDELCSSEFEIAPQAFFQINPPQAQRLYERALEYASGGKSELAFDLYCGAGTISLCLARKFKTVIGAELVPQAIENAKENARRNNIDNASFICADAGEAAAALAAQNALPDVVVVDPPRKGMSEEAVAAVASMQPPRVVYVSCNPATLARDIARFEAHGYTLTAATAVDMFPRTCHVESVALLCRKTEIK